MVAASDPVVILSAVRTPLGRLMGMLSPSAPPIGFPRDRRGAGAGRVAPEQIDEVFMGCVLPAGQGQAPARQAARVGGLPDSRWRHDDQQSLWLRHEGNHARA